MQKEKILKQYYLIDKFAGFGLEGTFLISSGN